MNKLQRVLLIDDECSQFQETIAEDFQQHGIDIRFCETKDEAINILDSSLPFDLVILDWFLEEDSNVLSRLILKRLQETIFVPVFIWSNHIVDYEESAQKGEITYPLIKGIAKNDMTAEIVQENISVWFQNSVTAQISNLYRQQIHSGVEKLFFDLAKIPNQDIAALLKFLVGDGITIDWSHDFILNLLHRQLIGDETFCERLRTLLRTTKSVIEEKGNLEERKAVLNKVLYYRSDVQFVRCGDIVKFPANEGEQKLGIVVTPACDLESRNTRFLEVVELQKLWDESFTIKSSTKKTIAQYKHPSFYFFPAVSVDEGITDLTAILKAKIVFEHQSSSTHLRYPETQKRMEYADSFRFNNNDVTLEFLCRLDNPYRSDFLQKLHAHNSRIGIPNIRNLLEE